MIAKIRILPSQSKVNKGEHLHASNNSYGTRTLLYDTPLRIPPRIDVLTLCRNCSRFFRSSSAASVKHSQTSSCICQSKGTAPLFSGSSALGSKKRYCRPTITEFRFRTGFQSSRRIFKHTFPSRSTFGWYIWISHGVNIAESGVNQTHRLHALDLRWLVRVVGVNVEREIESATLVHSWQLLWAILCTSSSIRTFVGGDGKSEVQEVGGVREVGLHGGWEVEFGEIWNRVNSETRSKANDTSAHLSALVFVQRSSLASS